MQWSDFLGKIFVFVVLIGFWEGKLRHNCQKRPTFTEEQLSKVVLCFERFDCWYCYVTSNKFYRILAESFKQGCKYCILRVEINNFRKDIFYWNKLSISIYFRILRKKILDIQQKKNQDFQNCIQHVRSPRCMKKCFFWISHNFTHLFGLRETHSKVRLKILLWVLQTACTCPNERFERNDFLSNLS